MLKSFFKLTLAMTAQNNSINYFPIKKHPSDGHILINIERKLTASEFRIDRLTKATK